MILIRGSDDHGSGHYLASRGDRVHNGIDIICDAGDLVNAFEGGRVTKIGFPYGQGEPKSYWNHKKKEKFRLKKALRYVQITDIEGNDARYFYVFPSLGIGHIVRPGQCVGFAQGVENIYPGITEHFHFEVLRMKNDTKVFSNPNDYLKSLGIEVRIQVR